MLGTSTSQQTLNASPPSACWGSGSTSVLTSLGNNEPSMATWCSTVFTPTSASTRTVTISTCAATVAAAACAAQPLLQAVVTFDDYPPGEVSAPSNAHCVTYCGTSMVTDSWVWAPKVPTVTGISPASGSINGGNDVTVTGSGFDASSVVTFVEQWSSSGGNDVVPATIVTPPNASGTSLTVQVPSVIEGTTYYVVVTTENGESPMGSNDTYTYTNAAPVITSISPSVGSIAGGNSI